MDARDPKRLFAKPPGPASSRLAHPIRRKGILEAGIITLFAHSMEQGPTGSRHSSPASGGGGGFFFFSKKWRSFEALPGLHHFLLFFSFLCVFMDSEFESPDGFFARAYPDFG